jgi:arylsulfatase A
MADDLGYGEVGCFGQRKIPTPNIDKLAEQGIRMTRSYSASPVCAPTRCSLLTGKHQGHAAIRGNVEKGGFGPNDTEGQSPLPASEVTIAQALKKRGYRSALVGKWGLGSPEPGETPLDHGFDFFYGYECQRRAHNYYPAYLWRNHQPDLLGNHIFDAHQKIAAPLATDDEYYQRFQDKTYSPTKLMEECVSFIRRSKGKPFFLYYAPTLPHVALQAPVDWIERFPRSWDPKPYLGAGGYLPTPRPHATYAAMIAYLDYTVGQVMQTLDETGTTNNTLIVFTSDNGPTFAGGVDTKFFNSSGGLRGGKMDLYEGGVRVPYVARWPGHIKPGSVSDHVNVCFDAMATLCEVAGTVPPKSDGLSYLPSLMGAKQPTRPYVYFEYPEAASMQSVLIGSFKVIRPNLTKHQETYEVYDLNLDPTESRDLSATRKDLVDRAKAIFTKEHRRNPLFLLPGIDSPGQSE